MNKMRLLERSCSLIVSLLLMLFFGKKSSEINLSTPGIMQDFQEKIMKIWKREQLNPNQIFV